ncbi:hypothetical protein ASC87_11605 [Rhizobacter sp. Root1221]|nr:hypothetical protein ASC87_11605 [Rhizobacter sp. Root1221]
MTLAGHGAGKISLGQEDPVTISQILFRWTNLARGMPAANGGPVAENLVFGDRNSSMTVRIEQMLAISSTADVLADERA